MLRAIVFLVSPLATVALVYWFGFAALVGCLALVAATFLLSTSGPAPGAAPVRHAEHASRSRRLVHRRSHRMART